MFYQHRAGKAWLGPVRVFSVQSNSVFLFTNGSICKVPRCNVQLWKLGDSPDDSGIGTSTDTGTESGEDLPKVSFEKDVNEDIEEKEVEEIEKRKTGSITAVEKKESWRETIYPLSG